jgi:hypothetical protein
MFQAQCFDTFHYGEECDWEDAALAENCGHGLGLLGDWCGATQWYGGNNKCNEIRLRLFEYITFPVKQADQKETAYEKDTVFLNLIAPYVCHLHFHPVDVKAKLKKGTRHGIDKTKITSLKSLLRILSGLSSFTITQAIFRDLTDFYKLLSTLPPCTKHLTVENTNYVPNIGPFSLEESSIAEEVVEESGYQSTLTSAKSNPGSWLLPWLQLVAADTLRTLEYTIYNLHAGWENLEVLLTNSTEIMDISIKFCHSEYFTRDGMCFRGTATIHCLILHLQETLLTLLSVTTPSRS